MMTNLARVRRIMKRALDARGRDQCLATFLGDRCLDDRGHAGKHIDETGIEYETADPDVRPFGLEWHQIDPSLRGRREVRSPAIEKLIEALRSYLEANDGGLSRAPLEDALREVNTEAGQFGPERGCKGCGAESNLDRSVCPGSPRTKPGFWPGLRGRRCYQHPIFGHF